jgi:hypothetical protein
MSTIALLTTEGDAHACGLAHGLRFAREIADNVATYLARFAASGPRKNATCRDRLASGTTIGNVLLRKMIPDPLPLLVRESNHPIFIADRLRPAILR